MKKSFINAHFVIGFMPVLCTFSLFAWVEGCSRAPSVKAETKEAASQEKAVWTCSMHPQIRQDHPGDCPICGMALVPLHSPASLKTPEAAPPTSNSSLSPIMPVKAMPEQSEATVIHLDAVQSSAGNIRISPVEEKMIRRDEELFGEFSYVTDKQIDFTWYYGGRIQKTLVDYNTTEIKEGTPLLEVYSDEAVADQRECLEMLMELRKHLVSEQKVFESKYGTNTEKVSLVGMSYEHKNMSARLSALEDRLLRSGMTQSDFLSLESAGKIRSTFTIKAPETGTLLVALPHVGERFTMDATLFRLVPLKDVWFVADVNEQDISLLKLGQEISIRSKSFPEKTFHGKLVFIGKEVDPRKRTVKARFLVPNPEGILLPQLSATGSLSVGDQKPQLAVPASSIIDTGMRQLVYVETYPGTYALRSVKIGSQGEMGEIDGEGSMRWVPVLEGLSAGEKVVTSGAFLIDAEAELQGLPASGKP
jgi:Cu(I)/Ag(I) efflux system membrane fusion protein